MSFAGMLVCTTGFPHPQARTSGHIAVVAEGMA